MDVSYRVRMTVLYRVIATLAFLGGFAIVVLGTVGSSHVTVSTLVSNPANVGEAIAVHSPGILVAAVLLGVLVWKLGTAYALFLTMPRETGRFVDEAFDNERLKSEVLDALDGRLAEIERDVAETRRSVQELKRKEHATVFDEGVHDDEIDHSLSADTGEFTERTQLDDDFEYNITSESRSDSNQMD